MISLRKDPDGERVFSKIRPATNTLALEMSQTVMAHDKISNDNTDSELTMLRKRLTQLEKILKQSDGSEHQTTEEDHQI